MAAISVKVPRIKLIEALQASLDKEKALPKPDGKNAQQDAFQAAQNTWAKKAIKEIAKNIDVANIRDYYRSKQVTFNIDGLDVDPFPVYDDFRTEVIVYQDVIKIRELENAIKLLSISEEEFVNASTYRTVVQYL